MDNLHRILYNLNQSATSQKTYDGQKRNDLKDSDFLFPETRSFPIVTPGDVKDAISNYGRMSSKMSYDTFLRKLYNKCKSKGPEFVDALPEASKDKLGLKKIKSYHEDIADPMSTNVPDIDGSDDESMLEQIDDSMLEESDETYNMVLSALKNIISNVGAIINNSDLDRVKENLTEPWVVGMIAVIEDNISTVHDFVKFTDSVDDIKTDAGNRPGLWDNIRKKKQREGKKYRPAKPGDKDRPDPEAWKLAQGCACCGK